MEWILGWIAFSALAGIIALNKGRSFFGFFLLSVILSPLFGIVAALVVGSDTAELERQQIVGGESKRCPLCAEVIRQQAIKCRFCGSDLPHNQPTDHSRQTQKLSSTAYQIGKSIGDLFR